MSTEERGFSSEDAEEWKRERKLQDFDGRGNLPLLHTASWKNKPRMKAASGNSILNVIGSPSRDSITGCDIANSISGSEQ